MKLTSLAAIAAIAAAGVAVACGGSGSSYMTTSAGGGGGGGGGGATNSLVMQGTAFSPAVDTIAVGSTVTWTNNDPYAHTVTYGSGPDSSFDSGSIAASMTFQHTFMTMGTYEYYCKIHGTATTGMRGTIVVK